MAAAWSNSAVFVMKAGTDLIVTTVRLHKTSYGAFPGGGGGGHFHWKLWRPILPYFGKRKQGGDIPPKSELLMFLYFTQYPLLPGQILCINTHPAKRYVR